MMSGTGRFPHLALPFMIVGAAAGWLSAGFFANPLVGRIGSPPEVGVALIAAAIAAATGIVVTRFCRGEDEQRYRIDDGPAAPRAGRDRWVNHAGVVLLAGALAGGLSAGVFDAYGGVVPGALGGTACAAAFVPVCLAVVAAARRSQRARMGSLVAGSDRRAVWGILATALSVATLWGLPSWAAAAAGDKVNPWPAAFMVGATGAVIAVLLAWDTAALRRARQALSRDLQAKEAGELGVTDTRVPRVDLGLGEELSAEVARPAAAYRGRDRAVALVIGSPKLAVSALVRAIVRGGVGIVLVAGVAGLHAYARSKEVLSWTDRRRCERYDYVACARVADAARAEDPARAAKLYSRACGFASPKSCLAAAEIYEGVARREEALSQVWHARSSGLRSFVAELLDKACFYGEKSACGRGSPELARPD